MSLATATRRPREARGSHHLELLADAGARGLPRAPRSCTPGLLPGASHEHEAAREKEAFAAEGAREGLRAIRLASTLPVSGEAELSERIGRCPGWTGSSAAHEGRLVRDLLPGDGCSRSPSSG